MINKTKKTQTILFASLIAAMILPQVMSDSAFAEPRDDKIERLGNEGIDLKEKIYLERDSVKKNQFEDDFRELKSQMRAIGIPTVGEYEANKSYWRDLAVQHHLDELERIDDESKKDDMKKVQATICTSDCGDKSNRIVKFQTAYGYDCYGGLWTCHAYAPTWAYASDGETVQQKLTVANSHNWIDPFWLIGGNQAMSVTYTYQHVNYDDGGSQVGNMYTNGDTQYINSSSDVDTVSKSKRVDNPRANYSVDTQWTVNSIS